MAVPLAIPIWAAIKALGKGAIIGGTGVQIADASKGITGNSLLPNAVEDWREENPIAGELAPEIASYFSPYGLARAAGKAGIKSAGNLYKGAIGKTASGDPNTFLQQAGAIAKLEAAPNILDVAGNARDDSGDVRGVDEILGNLAVNTALSAGVGGAAGQIFKGIEALKAPAIHHSAGKETFNVWDPIKKEHIQDQAAYDKLKDKEFHAMFHPFDDTPKRRPIPRRDQFDREAVAIKPDQNVAFQQASGVTDLSKVGEIGMVTVGKKATPAEIEKRFGFKVGEGVVRNGNTWLKRDKDGYFDVTVYDGDNLYKHGDKEVHRVYRYKVKDPADVNPELKELHEKLDAEDASDVVYKNATRGSVTRWGMQKSGELSQATHTTTRNLQTRINPEKVDWRDRIFQAFPWIQRIFNQTATKRAKAGQSDESAFAITTAIDPSIESGTRASFEALSEAIPVLDEIDVEDFNKLLNGGYFKNFSDETAAGLGLKPATLEALKKVKSTMDDIAQELKVSADTRDEYFSGDGTDLLKELDSKNITDQRKLRLAIAGSIAGNLTKNAAKNARYWTEPYLKRLEALGKHAEADGLRDILKVADGESASVGKKVDEIFDTFIGKGNTEKIARGVGRFMTATQFSGDFAHAALTYNGVLNAPVSIIQRFRTNPTSVLAEVPELGVERGIEGLTPIGDINAPQMVVEAIIQTMKKGDNEWDDLVKRLTREGHIDQKAWDLNQTTLQAAQDALNKLDLAETGTEKAINKIENVLTHLTVQVPEKHARLLVSAMAYQALKQMGASGDTLYRGVKGLMKQSLFDYGKLGKPAAFTGGSGQAFGFWKTWMAHMMFVSSGIAGRAISHNEYGKFVRWWLHNMPITGVAGSPVFLPATTMFELLNEDEQTFEDFVYEAMGDDDDLETAGDFLLYGAPAAMGWSLSSRAELPGTDLPRDAQFLTSIMMIERGKQIGQMIGTGIGTAESGGSAYDNELFRNQLYRGILPKAAHRLANTMGREDLLSVRTGYPIKKDLTFPERAGYILGFTPTEVELNYRIAEQLRNDKAQRRLGVTRAGKELFANRDNPDAQDRILRTAVAQGLPYKNIMKSYKSRLKEAGLDIVQRTEPDPRDLEKMLSFLERAGAI